MKKTIKVVGAIMVNDKNEIFCARRPEGKTFGGLWEFPGGKLEEGEKFDEALVRELIEELNIKVEVTGVYMVVEKEYDNFIINLTCLKCKILDFSSFTLREHSEWKWVKREELLDLDWVPTDIPVVETLQYR